MLTLPIKGRWFDMIKVRVKGEEYRAMTRYYDSRLLRYEGKPVDVCFRNGYRADSPKLYCNVTPRRGQTGRTEWGAQPGVRYWVLQINSVREK